MRCALRLQEVRWCWSGRRHERWSGQRGAFDGFGATGSRAPEPLMNVRPAVLQTPGFAHYSVAWSPFHNTRIAIASAANFGLVGNGRLHLVSLVPGGIKLDKLSVPPCFSSVILYIAYR